MLQLQSFCRIASTWLARPVGERRQADKCCDEKKNYCGTVVQVHCGEETGEGSWRRGNLEVRKNACYFRQYWGSYPLTWRCVATQEHDTILRPTRHIPAVSTR